MYHLIYLLRVKKTKGKIYIQNSGVSRAETQTQDLPHATPERYRYNKLLGLMGFEYAVTAFQVP
jgi:hypothetical protein